MKKQLRLLFACTAIAIACSPVTASAATSGVDPKADALLRAMSTYMDGLKTFSALSENTLEIVSTEGQKLQFTNPAAVTVSRPDKLFAERRGDIVNQRFYYDGKSLTLYSPDTKHYATVPAPSTVDAMLDFARGKLDVIAPGSDLIQSGAYDTLMPDVSSGLYVGIAVVDGVRCHHLAFRSSEIDWQLWVREGSRPLPCKYVITSKATPGSPQFTVRIVKWDEAPKVAASKFRFIPPAGAKTVEFLPLTNAR